MGRSGNDHVDDDFDVDFDDFDGDIADNYDIELYELLSPDKVDPARKKAKPRKKKNALSKLNSGPEIWDDDWIDPADDLMYGFDDSDNHS